MQYVNLLLLERKNINSEEELKLKELKGTWRARSVGFNGR